VVSASARADAPPPDPSGVKGPAGRNGGWGGSRGQGAARWRPRRAQTRSDRAGSTILPYRMVGLNTTHSSRPALFFYPGGSVVSASAKADARAAGGISGSIGLVPMRHCPGSPRNSTAHPAFREAGPPPLGGRGGTGAIYACARTHARASLVFF